LLTAAAFGALGVIFQSFQLVSQQTAFENVELRLALAGIAQSKRTEIGRAVLASVGLER